MAKVFKILNDRKNNKIIKNSDELVKEWREIQRRDYVQFGHRKDVNKHKNAK